VGLANTKPERILCSSAQEAEGYAFVEWTLDGAMISQTSSFTYTMPANNVQLTAHFELIPEPTFVLSLLADPQEGGYPERGRRIRSRNGYCA
jgi:uncharacterized repeat protein (TIGR02543 family)